MINMQIYTYYVYMSSILSRNKLQFSQLALNPLIYRQNKLSPTDNSQG
jgi:hypothetical protein